ncbi:group II intron reverse transcriptase/maturase [Lacrimispora defluvii]|uniref:Group II intron reverse transcriptase/maturase n=1 Tax=Lacrimispora defluvii TaxID=2719233 RepID=A0ABX1VKR0_9FIRM|nr:group II intron reverse transcriptase/maturase [Lacrimispora defluvii]NNJ28855.1 group II intron reverse transcriptase/maturase [Lacrimispora defluvii]
MDTKTLKRKQLRNNEYYDMQVVYDQLYENARDNANFTHLIKLVMSAENIKLAYRNIKNNNGSNTKGTDGKTIKDYESMNEEEMILYFQAKMRNYNPNSVRRVEIPKPNGKKRPLGIPCMEDRIIQQCLKQVLEPICEAKFYKHSYGFRPNRSTRHAVARYSYLVNIMRMYYVVDVDIKGFFDNVNHAKLMKQLWALGIRDKCLLSVIGKILKSEIEGIGIATKGVPQGGIISPLLANVVLNELDWWIAGQWENLPTRYNYKGTNHKYKAIRKTRLKEMHIVRYADDFKIFCSNPKTAEAVLMATKMWLKERLGLEVSEEKTKITYLKKNSSEFLGVKFKAVPKGRKFVVRSHITDKNIEKAAENIKKQIITIQRHTVENEVVKLNSIILGVHNYYSMATMCNIDFHRVYFLVKPTMNRLKKNYTRGHPTNAIYLKLYGNYTKNIYNIAGIDVFPLYGVVLKKTLSFKQEICNYTKEGRNLIHNKLNDNLQMLMKYLLKNRDENETIKFNDNRISKLAGQNGKSYITGVQLDIDNMRCCRQLPKNKGGSDDYSNLIWITAKEKELIAKVEVFKNDLVGVELDNKALKRLNSLRLLMENLPI